jgi:segregation and condensation protein B
MQDIKNKIEAVLFISGKFMDVEEIANFCSVGSVGVVRDAIKGLKEDYDKRETGLAVYEEKGQYKLNLKKEYNHLSINLVSSCELDPPTQATLAVIAYKQPALQAEIIKMRGNKAYDHIKQLKESEFITSEKSGRTRLLKLAPKFFDYFDVLENAMKEKFSEIGEKYKVEEPEKPEE